MSIRFRYVLLPFLLVAIHVAAMDWSGYRLPAFFLSGGEIVPLRDSPVHGSTIVRVDGLPPYSVPKVYGESRMRVVVTELGTQIVDSEQFGPLDVLRDFRFFILLSFAYLFLGAWFWGAMRDGHLAAICLTLMLALLSAMLALTSNRLFGIQHISLFLVSPALINMGLRTTGKSIPGRLLLAELVVVIFFGLLVFAGNSDPNAQRNLTLVSRIALFLSLFFVVALQLENALRSGRDPVERLRRWVLLSGTFFGYLIPGLLFEFSRKLGIPDRWAGDIFGMYFLFPAGLLYGAYRIQLVPYQFVLNQSIATGLVTGLFALVYGGALLVHNSLLPDQGSPWIVHIVFLLALVFFLDPARHGIGSLVEKRVFRIGPKLTESLERLALLYSGPLNIQAAITRFRKELLETLGVEEMQLLFSDSAFPGLVPRHEAIRVLPADNVIWQHLRSGGIMVAAYLAYGAGSREELYRFLSRNRAVLAIGLAGEGNRPGRFGIPTAADPARAAILIGPRRKGGNFRLSEIRYLQEAARLAELIIRNYELLARELMQRRSKQEITLAGRLQRSVSESPLQEVPSVATAFFNEPAASVSGDYLDLIRLDANRTAFLMGDVSGHGLGTGYLASAFRTMVRSHIENGMTLSETVALLNKFLLERYRGSEFITLIAILFDAESGRMEHINAAHPGPYLREASGKLIHLRDTQRLLGISTSPYNSTATVLKAGDRLFLYSDGVTETFNSREETYGDDRLADFFRRHGSEPLQDVAQRMREELHAFRGSEALDDDTSFLALEYKPANRPFRSFLAFLRGDDRT